VMLTKLKRYTHEAEKNVTLTEQARNWVDAKIPPSKLAPPTDADIAIN